MPIIILGQYFLTSNVFSELSSGWRILSPCFHVQGGQVLGGRGWQSTSTKVNFKISKSIPELKFPIPEGGGNVGTWNVWNLVLPPSVHFGWTSSFWHKILQHILSECITDSSLRKLIKMCWYVDTPYGPNLVLFFHFKEKHLAVNSWGFDCQTIWDCHDYSILHDQMCVLDKYCAPMLCNADISGNFRCLCLELAPAYLTTWYSSSCLSWVDVRIN